MFHPLNAFDLSDGRIVIDLVKHPRVFDVDRNGPNEGIPTLERRTLDPAGGLVRQEVIDDVGQEFPRVDERLVGRQHRYGYSVRVLGNWQHAGLLRHDCQSGAVRTHDYGPGRATMEDVFVPRHAGAAEDDGWLISMVHDANEGRGELVILDAASFDAEPVARVLLPGRVPYGFHGELLKSLRARAARDHSSNSEVIRAALHHYLAS